MQADQAVLTPLYVKLWSAEALRAAMRHEAFMPEIAIPPPHATMQAPTSVAVTNEQQSTRVAAPLVHRSKNGR